MKDKLYIKEYCRIRSSQIQMGGEIIFETESENFKDFAKSAYKALGIEYPKFFKMDNLSKLAFLGAHVLLKEYVEEENDVALVFGNRSSSLDTDLVYQKSIENKEEYYPSPAVFVYTLPNICLGEISIKFKLYTESSFFVAEKYDSAFFAEYTEVLLKAGKAKEVLCGWVELADNQYDAFLYLVSKNGTIAHISENLNLLFKE